MDQHIEQAVTVIMFKHLAKLFVVNSLTKKHSLEVEVFMLLDQEYKLPHHLVTISCLLSQYHLQ